MVSYWPCCVSSARAGKKNEKWKPLVVSARLGKHPTHLQNCSHLGKKKCWDESLLSPSSNQDVWRAAYLRWLRMFLSAASAELAGSVRAVRSSAFSSLPGCSSSWQKDGSCRREKPAPGAACSAFWRLAVCRASGEAYWCGSFLEADWSIALFLKFFLKFTFVRIGQ